MRIVVNGNSFKRAMEQIEAILEKSETTSSMTLTVEDNKIYLTTSTDVLYQTTLDVLESDKALNIAITVTVTPVASFLKATVPCVIEIEENYIRVLQNGCTFRLLHSEAVISKRSVPSVEGATMIDVARISEAVKVLSGLTNIKKTLKQVKPILFRDDYASMEYPTFIVRTKSASLRTVMPLELAKMVIKINPDKMRVVDGVVTFYSGDTVLQLPYPSLVGESGFNKIDAETQLIKNCDTEGWATTIQKLYKTMGKGYVTLALLEGGCVVTTSDLQNEIAISLGKGEGDLLGSATIPIENLVTALTVLKDDVVKFKIKRGEVLCLESPTTQVLMSIV